MILKQIHKAIYGQHKAENPREGQGQKSKQKGKVKIWNKLILYTFTAENFEFPHITKQRAVTQFTHMPHNLHLNRERELPWELQISHFHRSLLRSHLLNVYQQMLIKGFYC